MFISGWLKLKSSSNQGGYNSNRVLTRVVRTQIEFYPWWLELKPSSNQSGQNSMLSSNHPGQNSIEF